MADDNNGTDLPYRNASLSTSERVSDLMARLTLEEKAGLLFHDMLFIGPNGTLSPRNMVYGEASTEELVTQRMMCHFNILGGIVNVRDACTWYNTLQELARSKTRLGIPVTISTDPRNHFTDNVGTSFNAGSFSQWPETLGFAALRDEGLVERFGDIARQEYVACGIRLALHPQVDLATEPRWARNNATYGEDAELSGKLGRAYIRGFQGRPGSDKKTSVSCMAKHFPGGGPQKDGEDAHFHYGKEQVYPGGNWDYHLKPFIELIDEGTRWMMPYYGQPIGVEGVEEVGFGLNKSVITDLLKTKLGYKGIVCTDWGLVTDAHVMGQLLPARGWGCEHMTDAERLKKVIDAGCDQLGGESRPDLLMQLVRDGLIAESRLDESVEKLLAEKFELGLFDNPFVDVDAAEKIVGRVDFVQEAELTQRRAYTLLTNKDSILPLRDLRQKKIYVEGIESLPLEARQLTVVATPEEADIALLRLRCPYEPRSGGFEAFFHAGSLEFSAEEKARQAHIFKTVPTIVNMYLDRPGVFPEIVDQAAAVMVNYGSNINAFFDVLTGVVPPEGRLPFDLPRSMEAVRKSREDTPYDTENPVFKFGHGLQYAS